MKKTYQIIAMAILLFGISSCQKNKLDISGEVSAPLDGDWTSLEYYSYVAQFTIQSNSDWEIEPEGDWFVLYQTKGSGNATVKIEVVDNFGDVRREGKLTIKFLQDQSKNQVINLRQKSRADIDDNAEIQESNRRYGIGFGYDATGEYASSRSCLSQVFLVNRLIEDGQLTMDGSAQEAQKRTMTGSSVYDISQNLSVNAGVDAKYGGFQGEVTASFDQQYRENQFCEYGVYSVSIKNGYRTTETALSDLVDDYMSPTAKKAINGLSKDYQDAAGIVNLIKNYGTHVIQRAYMGGRLDYSMAADVTEISGEYEIGAFVSAAYEGAFVSGNGTVDEKYKQSYNQNKNNCYIKVRTLGGSVSAADILNQGEAGINLWTKSLTENKNQAMVDFDEKSLVPIWKLCSDPARSAQIKAYVESYVEGVNLSNLRSVKIDVPAFNQARGNTLIKTAVLSDGTPIAEICSEYIPSLSSTQRVTVVYPILSGEIMYKYGFFAGSTTHSPGRVSWNGNNYTYTAKSGAEVGAINTLYMKGFSFSTQSFAIPGDKILGTSTTDQHFRTQYDWKDGYHNYPIVKVGQTVWMREYSTSEYNSQYVNGWFVHSTWDIWNDMPRHRYATYNGERYCLYNRLGANYLQEPGKWVVPDTKVCNNLYTYVNSESSKCMRGAVTGLEFEYIGFVDPRAITDYQSRWRYVGQGINANIWAGEQGTNFLTFTPTKCKVENIVFSGGETFGFLVRLVRTPTFRYY